MTSAVATTSAITMSPETASSASDSVDQSARLEVGRYNLERMLLIDHITEQGQWLVVSDGHWSSREFDLQLSLGQRQEVRFNFIDKHSNLHRIGMNNSLFSLYV